MTDDYADTDLPESTTPPPALDPLWAFLDDDGITDLPPVRSEKYPEGKRYVIPSPSADTGLRLQGLAELVAKQQKGIPINERDVARLKLSDQEEREFFQQVMGSAYDEMMDDGVSWVRIQRLGMFCFTYFAISKEAAEKAAREGAFSGKAPAPLNRAQRRAQRSTHRTQ